MRILKWGMIFSVVVLSAVSCYWTPPEDTGLLQVEVTTRGLVPTGYSGQLIRVEFFHPVDISTTRESEIINWPDGRYYYPTSGATVPIDGQPWFEVPIDYDESSGDITVPEIPVGICRLRLGLWEFDGETYYGPGFEGISDGLVEITGGGTAFASVTLQNTYYNASA